MGFKKILKYLGEGGISLFFPSHCRICRKKLEGLNFTGICFLCWEKVRWREGNFCPRCGILLSPSVEEILCLECKRGKKYFEKLFSPFPYEGVMKEAILLFKYHKKGGIITKFRELTLKYLSLHPPPPFDLIIPVPLHRRKRRERGFNQAELIGNIIGKALSIPLEKKVLKRVKDTPTQTGLSLKEREKNVKGAFKVVKKKRIKGKKVLLVDDVYTTGSTVKEVSLVLKKAGVRVIYVFTLCRA